MSVPADRTGRTGSVATRDLDPYRVWYRAGGLYVVGHDHKSGEIRTFAVDRIERFAPTPAHFEVAPGFDFDAFVGASFGVIAEPAIRVRIAFDRRWTTYVEEHTWHPSQRLSPRAGGGLELAMEVGGTAELRQWVLSFGSGAEVLEPASLRDDVARELAASLQRYARAPAPATPRGRSPSPPGGRRAAAPRGRAPAFPPRKRP